MAAALPFSSGRVLLRASDLVDSPRSRRVFELAREHGAAVVCASGDQARTTEERVNVCSALYRTATLDHGLRPESLFFELPALSAAEAPEGALRESLESIAVVKAACPGSLALLDVGALSAGLPEAVRPAASAVFIRLASEAGLDAAILGAEGLADQASLPAGLEGAARSLIFEKGEARRSALRLLRAPLAGTAGV